ncbi:hypothetical protein Tco_0652965 [Tanacetum coccineum]|uniref:Uncharacterized protein n=1 Tax=Tanacetum coccineum TaxID=301880 RepID=A0ABQ4WZ01_9ASTR
MESVKESIQERAKHKREYDKRMNDRMIQSKEGKIDSSKALNAGLIVTESNETESERHVSSSRSENNIHTDDVDINSVNDKQPMADVQLVQTKDHVDSLIVQLNCKSVENADLKAQIQEKVFANTTLKNELKKIKGTSVDTKLAKSSTLGKPVLQPHRNESVVRQTAAFKSEQPRFSKPRFASQVNVKYDLPKSVTPHYFPIGRDPVLEKPYYKIVPSSSKNSYKESHGSNDMTHKYYIEEAKKKTQEKDRKSTTSVMPFAKSQNTTKSCKSKPKGNNQTSRVLPTSKSSCPTTTPMPKADHSRKSSPFSDFKHIVCSTCQKCVFNANHDACITKFLKEVNSRAKVQSLKTKNNTKPVEPTSHTQKPGRQIVTRNRFSPTKSFTVHEKINTPRSCLRWIPTGRIFNTVGLRWVPTGKNFTSSTTKVDCEPLNGLNKDITNPYECNQTLNVCAGTLNLSAGTSFNPKKERLKVWLLKKLMSKNQGPWGIHKQKQSPNSSQGVKEQQQQRAYFDDPCHELFHKLYISQGSSSNVHK